MRINLLLLCALALPVLAISPPNPGGAMVLWVRGDAGVEVDANGHVSAWRDQSGKGNDFLQKDPALQPLLVKDAANGLPAVRWDGVDDDLALATALPVSGKSVFAVIKWNQAKTYSFALGLDAGTDGYLRMESPTGLLVGGRYPVLYQNSIASPKTGYAPGDGRFIFHKGLDSLLQWNVYAITDNPPSNEKLKHLGMNEMNNTPANRFSGEIAEVLVYDRALTAVERLRIENYLENKYLGWPAMKTISVLTRDELETLMQMSLKPAEPLSVNSNMIISGMTNKILEPGRYQMSFDLMDTPKPSEPISSTLTVLIDGEKRIVPVNKDGYYVFDFIRPVGALATPTIIRVSNTAPPQPSLTKRDLALLFIQRLSPVTVADLQPDKILYTPGQQATARATLHNYAAEAVTGDVRVSEVTGLDDRRVLGTKTVTVPAGGEAAVELPYTAGTAEYGRDLLAEVLLNGTVAEERREPYSVADNLWKVAIGASQVGTTADYTEAGLRKQMLEYRKGYCNWFEKDFWAPDDWGMMTPPPGLTWYSGQARRHENTEKLQVQVQAAHEQGIKAITYGKCMAGGVPGWEMARAKPQWFSTDAWGRTMGRPADVWDMDHWQEADKYKYTDYKYAWTYRWVDLRREDALQHGIDQLIASAKQFGWDGVRYDSGGFRAHFVDGKFDGVDSYNARNMRVTKEKVWKALPGFLFGVNTNDPQAKDGACPLTPADPCGHEFREMLAGGGLWMFEGMRDKPDFWGRRTYKLWSDYARDMTTTMRTIRGYGGHACCSYGDTELYKYVIGTMVGCHDYMGEHLRAAGSENWGRFLTRWGQFVWDPRLRPLPDEEKVLKVTCPRPLWWQGFANELVVSPTKRYVIIHLLNPPVNDEIAKTKTETPAPVEGCAVSLLHGREKLVKATFITPGFPNRAIALNAKYSREGDAGFTIRRLDLWGMLVVELEGTYTVSKDPPALTEPLSAAEKAEMERCKSTYNVPVAEKLLDPAPQFDPEKAKPKAWAAPTVTPPADLKVGGEPGADVLIVNGFYHDAYRLPQALALLAPEARVATCTTRTLPRDYPSLYKYDVVVLVDMGAEAWDSDGLQRLADFARAGGRLVILGGPFTLGQGFFAGSPLAAVLPVEVRQARDVYQAPKPLLLGAKKGVPFLGKPALYYFHAVAPRPGAVARLWAGELPVCWEAPAGAGRIAVFAGTPLGEPTGAGETPFWLWTGWPEQAVLLVLGK